MKTITRFEDFVSSNQCISFHLPVEYINDKSTNDCFFQEQEDDAVNQAVAMETDSMDGDSDTGSKTGRRHPFFHR